MTAHKIGFLIWPSTKALTLALAEEALRVAQRVHPDVVYELSFLLAEPATEGAWQLPGEAMGRQARRLSETVSAGRRAANGYCLATRARPSSNWCGPGV